MNRKSSKLTGFFLLLAMLAAGFSWYLSQKKDKNHMETIHLHPDPHANKQFTISGSVIRYGSNHEGDIDKLLLASNQKEIWLHFPPHTARLVTSVAIINAQIVALAEQKGPEHKEHQDNSYALKYLTNSALRKKIDLTEIPSPIPRKGFEVEITGSPSLNQQTNTFLLAGKMVTLPPHMAHDLFPLINQAKIITVKGHMRDSTDGFLSESGLPVIKANSVKIDRMTYKIR